MYKHRNMHMLKKLWRHTDKFVTFCRTNNAKFLHKHWIWNNHSNIGDKIIRISWDTFEISHITITNWFPGQFYGGKSCIQFGEELRARHPNGRSSPNVHDSCTFTIIFQYFMPLYSHPTFYRINECINGVYQGGGVQLSGTQTICLIWTSDKHRQNFGQTSYF